MVEARVQRRHGCPGTPSAPGIAERLRRRLVACPATWPSKLELAARRARSNCISKRARWWTCRSRTRRRPPRRLAVEHVGSRRRPRPCRRRLCGTGAGRHLSGKCLTQLRDAIRSDWARRRRCHWAWAGAEGRSLDACSSCVTSMAERMPSANEVERDRGQEDHRARQGGDPGQRHRSTVRSVLSIRPHSGSGGFTPRPRKERPEARIIDTAIRLVA